MFEFGSSRRWTWVKCVLRPTRFFHSIRLIQIAFVGILFAPLTKLSAKLYEDNRRLLLQISHFIKTLKKKAKKNHLRARSKSAHSESTSSTFSWPSSSSWMMGSSETDKLARFMPLFRFSTGNLTVCFAFGSIFSLMNIEIYSLLTSISFYFQFGSAS